MKICIIIPPAPGLFDQRTNVPLGPLYIAAVLEKAGHDVKMISLLGYPIPATWPEADVYAMGFSTPQVGPTTALIYLIRAQYPDALILAGGAHPTARPWQTLQMGFDIVLKGEGEITVLEIMRDIERGQFQSVYEGELVDDLDTIPMPARHLLPREDFFNDATAVFRGAHQDGHVTSIMGSRGCRHMCAFCSNPLYFANTRYRSAENIVTEMIDMVEQGVTCFKFQDDTFTLNPAAVEELGQECAHTFAPGTVFTRMNTRVNKFSEDMIPALNNLYLEVASFGIESGSQSVLNMVRKGTTIAQCEDALRIAKDAGYTTLGLFVFGLPGENAKTVDETIEFWRRNRPYMDAANLAVFVPYPGCDIAERPHKYRVHIINHDWNRYWIVQKETVLALPYGVSFDEMIALKRRSFEAFAELGYGKPDWAHDKFTDGLRR
jgi:anaerobic magnesium-protoporphyrin IX monomethyl ester cyclase